MNLNWISERSAPLLAVVIGLGFIGIAYIDAQYRYFHLVVALAAFWFAYKRLTRRETPFEKREREMRRNFR